MNRREFLKLAGITFAASTLDLTFPASGADSLISDRVRILNPITVRALPFQHAAEGVSLLPDSVHRIEAIRDGWVCLPTGYVPETVVQPMLNPHGISLDALPAWVEVIAPYAALRAYAI